MFYKPSQYNRWVTYDEKTKLLFNGMSCALVALDSKNEKQVKVLLSENLDSTTLNLEEQAIMEHLLMGKYVVEADIDELDQIKINSRVSKYSRRELKLVILPTYNCNFYCTYCYESCTSQSKHAPMTIEVENYIYDFVKEQLKKYRFETVNISWYGGEPLLEYEQVIRMMTQLREICECYQTKLSQSMITNGYLLTRERAITLKNMGLERIQLTLDGTEKIHDQRRMLKNREGTYKHTIEVLKEVAPIVRTVVRINVDRENLEDTVKLLEVFKEEGLKPYIGFDFSPLTAMEFGCSSISGSCFTDEEFSAIQIQLYRKAVEMGYRSNFFPLNTVDVCSAESLHGYVIEPTGAVKRCYAHVGNPQFDIGHISDSRTFSVKSTNWLLREPLENKACQKCDLLPICMGGCYAVALEKGSQTHCSMWKYNLNDAIIFSYEQEKKLIERRKEREMQKISKEDLLDL